MWKFGLDIKLIFAYFFRQKNQISLIYLVLVPKNAIFNINYN